MFDKLLLTAWLLAAAMTATANVPGLKDPTRPLRATAPVRVEAGAEAPRLTLESVLIGGGRRVAVINGLRMTEGQERDGVRVHAIRPDGVVVSVDGSPRMRLSISNSRMHKELR